MKAIERLKIYLWVRFFWKFSMETRLEAIRRFEFTEDDSAWQLLRGAHLASNPVQAANLFTQAVEETKHSEEFRRVYHQLSGKKVRRLFLERSPLVKSETDIERLFAECAVGEAAAADRFKAIARVETELEMKRLLIRILADEAGHVMSAEKLVSENRSKLKGEEGRIRNRRFKEAWLRSGRKMTGVVSTALIAIVYFSLGGFFRNIARRKLGYGSHR